MDVQFEYVNRFPQSSAMREIRLKAKMTSPVCLPRSDPCMLSGSTRSCLPLTSSSCARILGAVQDSVIGLVSPHDCGRVFFARNVVTESLSLSLSACIQVNICVCIHVLYTYLYLYVHIYIYIYLFTYRNDSFFICIYQSIWREKCIWVHMYMYVYMMSIHINIYTHVYACMPAVRNLYSYTYIYMDICKSPT